MGKTTGKESLGLYMCRLENIEMNLKQREWIDLAQNKNKWRAIVNPEINSGLHNIRGTTKETSSFSIRTQLNGNF